MIEVIITAAIFYSLIKFGFWVTCILIFSLFALCWILDLVGEINDKKLMRQQEVKIESRFVKPKQKPNKNRSRFKRRQRSQEFKQSLYAHQDGRCNGCKHNVSISDMHVDHITPLAAGGLDCDSNLQLLCVDCNMFKGCKPLSNFQIKQMRSV